MNSNNKTIEQLIMERDCINNLIKQKVSNSYQKYGMSDQVVNDNPYSRLMALKKMGIITNYDEIKSKSIVIIGIGGIGSVCCEMLVRCGIGKIIMYDYDRVELANMNRMFFTPAEVGLSKVQAAKKALSLINPEVLIQSYNFNITLSQGYEHLGNSIKDGSLEHKQVDLVLCCVDNYSARMSVNSICNKLNQIWFESGVSQTALSGHIQLMLPGQTGCFACASPLAISQGTQHTIKREGVCAASLPTTMSIIAGFLSQSALKFLLKFGSLSYCLTYNAQSDFFNSYKISINSQCKQPSCQQVQTNKKNKKLDLLIDKVEYKKIVPETKIEHTNNEWGIQIIDSSKNNQALQIKNIASNKQQTVQELMSQFSNL